LDLFYRVGINTIDNAMIKKFASSRSNVFISYIKNKIRRKPQDKETDKQEITKKYDLLVFGNDEEKLDYRISTCCNPIPGDNVFGFITIKDGIKIHKKNCPNALRMQSNYDYRILKAKWIDSTQEEFTVSIDLTGIDKIGLLNNITNVISENMNMNIRKLNLETDGGIFKGNIIISVKTNNLVNKVIEKLKKLNGIEKVQRL
jgi:GTP pyrophosphokinase